MWAEGFRRSTVLRENTGAPATLKRPTMMLDFLHPRSRLRSRGHFRTTPLHRHALSSHDLARVEARAHPLAAQRDDIVADVGVLRVAPPPPYSLVMSFAEGDEGVGQAGHTDALFERGRLHPQGG
jgi:hypothetical protein